MACKTEFCWCFVFLLQSVQKENFKQQSSYIIYSNTVDHQINRGAVAGGGRLNFPVVNNVNIGVTAKIRNVDIDVAALTL